MVIDFLVLDFFHWRKILKVEGRDGRDPQNREKNAPAGRFTCMICKETRQIFFAPCCHSISREIDRGV
jgi:hypothetical protein